MKADMKLVLLVGVFCWLPFLLSIVSHSIYGDLELLSKNLAAHLLLLTMPLVVLLFVWAISRKFIQRDDGSWYLPTKREYERSRENWADPKDYGYIIADKSSKSDYDFVHLPQEKE